MAEDFNVIKMAMPYDEFTACVGIPSAARRKRPSEVIVRVPILKEKEVRAAVPSRLRPRFIPITPGACTIESSILPQLAGYVVFHDVIGHSADVAVYGNVIGMIKIGEMRVTQAHLIGVPANPYAPIIPLFVYPPGPMKCESRNRK